MPFSSTPQLIAGELDHQWAPTLDVEFLVNTIRHVRRCHLDTGSLDASVITDYGHATSLGLQFQTGPRAPRHERIIADGSSVSFVGARTTINWFTPRSVTVLAPDPTSPVARSTATSPVPPPRILLGVPLLLGTTLAIDFLTNPGAVRITAPPPGYVPPLV